MLTWTADYLTDARAQYRAQKDLADAALARCPDALFFFRLPAAGGDREPDQTNSIAILVKHLAGNLRSRWTDFLTTDGEKPDRGREREFVDEAAGERAAIMARWDESWRIVFATLDALTADDLGRSITIRGEPHSVLQAIQRNLLHTTHHAGQIDLLASALPDIRTVGTMAPPPVGQQITFLYTADLATTARFYEEALGLPLALDQGDCRIYRVSRDGLLGFCQRAEAPREPAGIIVTLVTEDVDGWYARLSERGVVFDQPPARNPKYAIYHCLLRDPNGYLIEIQRFE